MKVLVSRWQIPAQIERVRIAGGTLLLLQKSCLGISFTCSTTRQKAKAKKAKNRKDQCSGDAMVDTQVSTNAVCHSTFNSQSDLSANMRRTHVNVAVFMPGMMRSGGNNILKTVARLDITSTFHEEFLPFRPDIKS